MNRTKYRILSIRIILIIILHTAVTGLEVYAGDKDNPNILMIIIDDLNDWIGVMNAHPNGVRF